MLHLVLVCPESPSICDVMVPQPSLVVRDLRAENHSAVSRVCLSVACQMLPRDQIGVVRLWRESHRTDVVSFPLCYIQRASCCCVLSSVADLDRLVKMGVCQLALPREIKCLVERCLKTAQIPRFSLYFHSLPLVWVHRSSVCQISLR